MNKDTIQATLSDLHVGSQYSICADKLWEGMNNRVHQPNSLQVKLIEQWKKFSDELAAFRKGKRLKLFLMGDLIEGSFHGDGENWTTNPKEMAAIAEEIIIGFQKRVKWQAGDELYCLRGTFVHSEDYEDGIGENLNAVRGENGRWAQDDWRVETNGRITWAIHQWVSAGTGAGEGASIYNGLKTIDNNSLKDGSPAPDIVYGGHFHKPGYAPYGWRRGNVVGVRHGIICPSWKYKDRYSAKVTKFERNVVGGMMQLITAEGVIDTPKFCVI